MDLPILERPVDNTAQSAYMNCPREFFFSMILHRRSREESSPLSFGSIWHKILETHYKTGADIERVKEVAFAYIEKHPMPVSSDYRTAERALMDYEKRYLRSDKWKLSDDVRSTVGFPGNPMVELTTSVQGPELAHAYAGKIDRMVDDQFVFVEDHKTTSRFDKSYFRQYEMSNQMMGYTYIASQILPSAKVVGVRINVYHVLTEKTDFHRQLITFSPAQLSGWANNYNKWIARIRMEYWSYMLHEGHTPDQLGLDNVLADFLLGLDPFPAHFGDNGCARKFGFCTYFSVCKLPPRVQMKALEQDFDVKPWNPLDAEEE